MIMELILGLAAVTVSAAQTEPNTCATARPAACLPGIWTGPFANGTMTFEFARAGDVWTGRYRTTNGKTWHALQSLTVAGGTVRFAIDSKPQVGFEVALNPSGDTLSGKATIPGLTTLPFVATRDPR